ncbi:MAG TPA: TonB-dependent receptor, partial [Bacteroidia bacterium]|nr:TonB-dependent receptor [Bacteroidia bacterium]
YGKFHVHLSDGNYSVSFVYLGYKTKTIEVVLPKDSSIHVQLSASTLISNEVVVSATRAGDKTPTAYTNIDKEYLQKSNVGQDMPFLLNFTPSMVTTSDAGAGVGYTYIHLRGSDATRINVTIDGVPINDAEDQGVYWVDMPDIVSSTDNIQIQRGVGTSTNGAGAFGGSINIETTKLSTQPYVDYSSSAGSYNTFKNTLDFGTGLLDGHWAFDGRASKITSDGYIDRATSNFESAFFDAGYYTKTTMIKAVVFTGKEKTYQAWYGVPQDSLNTNRTFNPAGMYYDANGKMQFYPNETDNYEQDYFQLHISQQLGHNWELNGALFQTNGWGYYEDFDAGYNYSAYGLANPVYGGDTVRSGNFVEDLWLNNKFYGATYTLKYSDHNRLTADFGGAWDQYYGQHYDNVLWAQNGGLPTNSYQYVSNTALKTDFNFFARANYQIINKLNLFADMQYRHIDYSFLGFNDSLQNVTQTVKLDFFNPKGGLSYDLSTTQNVYASVAVGNKEPSRDDYTQSTPSSRPLPEHLVDWEAGYKQHWKNVAVQANLYYMDYKNQLVLNGQVNDVGAYNRVNVPQSYREGIELQCALQPVKWLRWDANATYSVNKIKNFNEYVDSYDSGKNVLYQTHPLVDISFSPSWIVGSIFTVSPVKNLSFSLLTKYVGKQFMDNTGSNDRAIPAYFTNDFRINYALPCKKWLREVDFTLLVNNITNLKYVSNGYTYEYIQGGVINNQNSYFPQAPTNFLAGVSFKF